MSNIWFTSDLHLGHESISDLRGFGSTATHDIELCDRWIDSVSRRDQVWVLGDIAISRHDLALSLIEGLPGTKHLISGNHDPSHPMHRKSATGQARMLEVFASVQPFARRKVGGEDVLLSHFPYNGPGGDRGEIRHPQWRLPDLGEWLLHGHTHMEDQRRHGKQIHVGLDAWDLAPVQIETIAELMKEEIE